MDPRTYLKHYADQHGGTVAAVATRLGIPYQTLAAVYNGNRGIGHKLARRMAAADPLLDANVLIWVRPVPNAGQPVCAKKKRGGV